MSVGFLLASQAGPNEGFDLTRYVWVCCVLVAGIALLGFGFQRLFARTLRVRAAQRSLAVLDVLPLGSKQRLLVVRCYDRSFLLGCGEREVRRIAELDVDDGLVPARGARRTEGERSGSPAAAPAEAPVGGTSSREAAGFAERLLRVDRTEKRTDRRDSPERSELLGGRGILG